MSVVHLYQVHRDAVKISRSSSVTAGRQAVSHNVKCCCEGRQRLTHLHSQKAQAPAKLTLSIMMTKYPDACSPQNPQKGLIHLLLSVTTWIAVRSQVTKLDLSWSCTRKIQLSSLTQWVNVSRFIGEEIFAALLFLIFFGSLPRLLCTQTVWWFFFCKTLHVFANFLIVGSIKVFFWPSDRFCIAKLSSQLKGPMCYIWFDWWVSYN